MAAITMSSGAEWRLFPPPVKQAAPAVGEKVFVRMKSAKEVGKKGVVFAFEKVEVTAAPPPGPAHLAGGGSKEVASGCSSDGGGSIDGGRTTVWREVKKRKKRKKRKKWEDTRVVVRVLRGDEGDNPFDCRARPSRLVPIYDMPPSVAGSSTGLATAAVGAPLLVLLTAETLPYRLLAASQVRPDDRVLEVGCSTGETTAVLVKYVPRGHVVALDVGADMVERTKERLKLAMSGSDETCTRVRVSKIDPFLDPRGAAEAASALIKPDGEDERADGQQTDTGRCGAGGSRAVDAVFIDIGGNREVRGVARMIAFARTAFAQPPRLIVVKSQALVEELKANHGGADEANEGCTAGRQRQCGKIAEGDLWFRELLARSTAAASSPSGGSSEERRRGRESRGTDSHHIPKHFHPNKAPLRLSPKDGVTPICRYHNYHREGCKKGERCPFEHAVCHWCLQPGHVALVCDDPSEFSALG